MKRWRVKLYCEYERNFKQSRMLSTGSIISAGLWEINQIIANGERINELAALKPALYAEYDAATNGKERHIAREKIKAIDKASGLK